MMSNVGMPTTGRPVAMANALTIESPTRRLVKDPGPKAMAKPSSWLNFIPAESKILSNAGMDKSALIVVTCLVTAIATIVTGLFANAPIAMAPGMGLNAFFAYTLVITQKINWQTALGVVFLSGLFFLILTLIGLRKKLVEAIPSSLISAISVGIGLFITFIGLQNLGIVITHPVTLVQAGNLNTTIMIGLAGLIVMIFLEMKKVKSSLLIGIVFATVLAILFGKVNKPQSFIASDISISAVALKLDILGNNA